MKLGLMLYHIQKLTQNRSKGPNTRAKTIQLRKEKVETLATLDLARLLRYDNKSRDNKST